MKTKYFNKISITAICILMLSASCKKFLDQRPITDVSPEFVFTDVGNTYKALISVYSRLIGDQGYGIRVSLYYPVDNDEMQGPTGAGDADRRDIARYAATSTNAQLSSPFNQMFQGIEYANICIDNIPNSALYTNGTDQQKKQLQRMYGEALTLRAQFYFEAIRNWGDLPAHFTASANTIAANPYPTRTDRDTLYAQLLNDLKIAEDLVPWRNDLATIGDAPDERITKGAVKGLRARIALFRGGYSLRQNGVMERRSDYLTYYQIAHDECNDIINSNQHSLNSSFKSLWKDQVGAHVSMDPNGELMFQASAIGLSGAEDTKLGYYDGPSVISGTTTFGNKSINVLPTYFYLFDSTDTRRDVACCFYNLTLATDNVTLYKTGQAITAINDGKYRRDWVTPGITLANYGTQYLGTKWQILRYSDVLLMFAETENELKGGPTAAAYNAINMVRRRGFGKAINTPVLVPDATNYVDLSGLDKTNFFKALVKERSLELGGEGIRKYDLIRWNLLATAISETKANLTKMAALTVWSPFSYMTSPPDYSLNTPNLPIAMYYKNNYLVDDYTLWFNPPTPLGQCFYKPAPTTTPAGTTKVAWFTSAIGTAGTTSALGRFATNFVSGKSELLPIPQAVRDANPNFTQNPGYQ